MGLLRPAHTAATRTDTTAALPAIRTGHSHHRARRMADTNDHRPASSSSGSSSSRDSSSSSGGLLAAEAVLTQNPWEANLFVVPTWSIWYSGTCVFVCVRVRVRVCACIVLATLRVTCVWRRAACMHALAAGNVASPAAVLRHVIVHLKAAYPFWDAMGGGRNHVFWSVGRRQEKQRGQGGVRGGSGQRALGRGPGGRGQEPGARGWGSGAWGRQTFAHHRPIYGRDMGLTCNHVHRARVATALPATRATFLDQPCFHYRNRHPEHPSCHRI